MIPAGLAAQTGDIARRHIEAWLMEHGYEGTGSIPEEMSFRDWCEELGRKGLKVDRKPFKLSDRPALVPIYDAIPTRKEDAYMRRLVIQKATQLGLTVWETLADIYMMKKWGPISLGMYLPAKDTASTKSEVRFMPIIRSNADLYREMTYQTNPDGSRTFIGEGNIMTRKFGESVLSFLWTSSKTATESMPMDVVSLDEVQEMPLGQIDKVLARMGDSDIRFALLLSTANIADMDINWWYQRGSQEVWHTRCPHCGAESDLSDPAGVFPSKSVTLNTGQVKGRGHNGGPPLNDYVWTCPECGWWIEDPQQGRYIAQAVKTSTLFDPDIRSFLLPRTISPRITAGEMYRNFMAARTGDTRKNFYNRTLARPYIDADQLPVTLAHCAAAVEAGRVAGVQWMTSGKDTYMGVDQMGGWLAVIIKRRMPDGRQAVVHVDAIFDNDCIPMLDELMKRFGVAVAVLEELPNANEARKFANRFPRRAFIARYPSKDMITWADQISRTDQKTSEEDRDRFVVRLNQYAAMQNSLYRIRDGFCLFPDPKLHEVDVIDNGVNRRIPILQDWVFDHFTKTALVVEQHPETRRPIPKVMKIKLDPHFAYANMLCDVAWARSNGTGSFFMAGQTGPSAAVQKAVEAMPGLPNHVAEMMTNLPASVCGRCYAWKDGQCTERGFSTGAAEPSCDLFIKNEG